LHGNYSWVLMVCFVFFHLSQWRLQASCQIMGTSKRVSRLFTGAFFAHRVA
jgi:hypothetical protein